MFPDSRQQKINEVCVFADNPYIRYTNDFVVVVLLINATMSIKVKTIGNFFRLWSISDEIGYQLSPKSYHQKSEIIPKSLNNLVSDNGPASLTDKAV